MVSELAVELVGISACTRPALTMRSSPSPFLCEPSNSLSTGDATKTLTAVHAVDPDSVGWSLSLQGPYYRRVVAEVFVAIAQDARVVLCEVQRASATVLQPRFRKHT